MSVGFFTATRTGERTLVMEVDRWGWLAQPFARAVRAEWQLEAGRTYDHPLVQATLVELTSGGTDVLEVRFDLDLDDVARVIVCEIGARVVEWNRRWFADANGRAVDDPRVEVAIADVADVLRAAPGSFDLVLLGLGADAHTASLLPDTAVLGEERWGDPRRPGIRGPLAQQ